MSRYLSRKKMGIGMELIWQSAYLAKYEALDFIPKYHIYVGES